MNDLTRFGKAALAAGHALALTLSAALLGATGCGGGEDSAPSLAAAAAPTVGVTSPTARGSGTDSSDARTASASRLALSESDVATEIPDSVPIDELNETLEQNLAEETSPEDIVENVPATPFGDKVYHAACFGPSLRTVIDGTGADRPVGDLGIFYRTKDDATDEACASAQISALMSGDPANANAAILLVQAAVKSYVDANGDLPSAESDVLELLPAVEGIGFTSATLSPIDADADGRVGYHTRIEMEISGETSMIELWQTPTSDDYSSYKGLLQLVSTHVASSNPSTAGYRGLSMLYEESADEETYVIETAANRNTTSSDFFDSVTGRVDFDSAAAGELLNKMIVSQNTSTGAMTLHYAWQAGSGDGATRAFAAQVDGTAEGSTGIAWYGYGDSMQSLSDDTSAIWPEKMYCNWTNGLSGGVSQSNLQKQVLAREADSQSAEGALVFTADSDDQWVYAPTDSCSDDSAYTVSSASAPGATTPAFLIDDTAHHTGASNLVEVPVGAASLVDAVTIPDYSKP